MSKLERTKYKYYITATPEIQEHLANFEVHCLVIKQMFLVTTLFTSALPQVKGKYPQVLFIPDTAFYFCYVNLIPNKNTESTNNHQNIYCTYERESTSPECTIQIPPKVKHSICLHITMQILPSYLPSWLMLAWVVRHSSSTSHLLRYISVWCP